MANDIATADAGLAPIVEIATGKLRGALSGGIYSFKGIPYGASTAGRNRFMPPEPPLPWSGVRNALVYAGRAWQLPNRPKRRPELETLLGPADTTLESEDCLTLNVWTPGLRDGAKRPVMVWLHGGGFRTGSGNSVFYEGKSLAQKHGAVVVTVTHRLNVLGFLHLAEVGGERFRQASNVGMQDLVLALEWLRDNIDAFGGDPRCITIFGQSGGGGKTAILNGMPAAKGLFHRAIIQSTLWDTAITASEISGASAAAEMFLARAGVKPGETDKLQAMPHERLIDALTAPGDISTRYVPVKDGQTLTVHPFEPTASALSASVPMMCGSNETESVPYANPEDPFWTSEIADEAALRDSVKRAIRIDDAAADRLIALYRSHRPADSRGDLALIIASDNSPLRLSAHAIAERKAAQASAPVYTYLFKWRSPVDGGKLRSMHCMEIPFVFDHVDNCTFMNGRGADRYALAETMAEAWVSFARTGNPNHPGLTDWPAFDGTRRSTLVFDRECGPVSDPYREERRALDVYRAARSTNSTSTASGSIANTNRPNAR